MASPDNVDQPVADILSKEGYLHSQPRLSAHRTVTNSL